MIEGDVAIATDIGNCRVFGENRRTYVAVTSSSKNIGAPKACPDVKSIVSIVVEEEEEGANYGSCCRKPSMH